MNEFSYNYISSPQHVGCSIPPWLTIDRDPRKVCTLLLGNGFTLDYLDSTGLSKNIQCDTEEIFPHLSAKYYPTPNDYFTDSKFWDEKKWPKLFEHYEKHGMSGREFFDKFKGIPVNPEVHEGLWSINSSTIDYELRCYLWHLFRSFHISRLNVGQINIDNWKWAAVLHLLVSEFSVRIITYNYDLFLELFFMDGMGLVPPSMFPTEAVTAVEQPFLNMLWHRRAGSVVVLKPHGSIGHRLNVPGIPQLGPNPWLTRVNMDRNRIEGICTEFETLNDIKVIPVVPDLVPPGHNTDHICNPASKVAIYSKQLISQSDLVISCGLSGTGPDKAEVTELLNGVPEKARIIQVGLAGDDENTEVGTILGGGKFISYNFLEADKLFDVLDILTGSFELRWPWKFQED